MRVYLLPEPEGSCRRDSAPEPSDLAGYVDLGERVPDAAIRETHEESLLHVRLDGLLNVYSYANVGIVLVVYRATVTGGIPGVTPESQEIRAFHLDEIPWASLAFPSTREALADYVRLEESAQP